MPKILIVDTGSPDRHLLSSALLSRGHEVAVSESGADLLRRVKRFGPDLVLVDLQWAEEDASALLQGVLEERPDQRMLALTGAQCEPGDRPLTSCRSVDWVEGSLSPDALARAVERFLGPPAEAPRNGHPSTLCKGCSPFPRLIGSSVQMKRVFELMEKVAPIDATVLITGESGTGKELVARALHARSDRARGAFVAVNCGAVPDALFESEFFGHERGAFTDAHQERIGKLEQASGGTLFLDEVGNLPLSGQAKLLRALEESEVVRVGGRDPKRVDARFIAATNRDLSRAVRDGRFQEDVYWRLDVVRISLPPLRHRRDDLPLLIDHFLNRFRVHLGLEVDGVTPEAHELLCEYAWPGNVRELQNTLCRSMIVANGRSVEVADLPRRVREGRAPTMAPAPADRLDLNELPLTTAVATVTERVEKALIMARLSENRGNRSRTARSLGVSRKTLFNKMRRYGLEDGGFDWTDLRPSDLDPAVLLQT